MSFEPFGSQLHSGRALWQGRIALPSILRQAHTQTNIEDADKFSESHELFLPESYGGSVTLLYFVV